MMPTVEFCQAILQGLEARGLSGPQIAELAGISPKRVSVVLAGKGSLSDKVLSRIEDASGATVGQLAALSIEPKGGPLTDLANQWAKVWVPKDQRERLARKEESRHRATRSRRIV